MTDKINDNDRQRIYKEVNRIFNESESVDLVHELMFKVGEYATLYERQQQANLKQDDTWLKKLEFYTKGFDTKKFQKVEEYVKWVRVRDDLPAEPLEAEHRELLKAVDLLKRTRYPFPEQPTLQEEIELFLNSHKTK